VTPSTRPRATSRKDFKSYDRIARAVVTYGIVRQALVIMQHQKPVVKAEKWMQ